MIKHDGDANAGVGHVKGRPGMRERNMQIEEQKIDDVTVEQTVGQISQDSGQEQGERNIAQRIR